jgi:8-amino-7-oxononanoate synthase
VEHWLDTCSELQALKASHPMMDAVIDEVDGRMIRIGDHWLADFASCNYLGFDLDREIIDAIPAYLDEWGTHPSWSRLLGSPVLYEEIETRLTELLGSEDSLVLPTITHIHMSVIPLLAASGTIFLDSRAHKTIYDGCQVARARGAAVKRFRFEDPDHLDQLLRAERDPTRLVCMDGVNSMTGNAPDIRAFAAVAREHGALLYVDDAHGFGVIGERGQDDSCVYGSRGNSVVRHAGETYDDVVLIGGFSKAYSSLLAFIACPTEVKDLLKVAAPPTCTRDRRRWPRSPASSRASTSTSAAATSCAACSTLAPRGCSTACTGSGSTRPTARASRSSRSHCATTSASTRSAGCSSTAAST